MVLSSLENNLAVFQNWAEKSFTNIDMHRIGQIVTGVSSSVLGVLEFIKKLADRSDRHGVSVKY